MKVSNIIFAFSLLGLLFQAKAQTALFNVLASKGNVKYVAAGSTEEKVIRIGAKLFSNDKIVVGESAYLGLASTNGKTIEIKRTGTYEVSKLSSEIASQNASVSKKYVDFLAGEINNNGQDMAKNKYKYMKVTGSVDRGGEAFTIYAPKISYVLMNAPLYVKWTAKDSVETYKVTLSNIFDEELYSIETTSTSTIIDLPLYNVGKDADLFIVVTDKKNVNTKTDKINIKSLMAKDAELSNQAKELKSELAEQTALNKFVLASYYADQDLVMNAVEQYEAAIALEPEVEDYKVVYGEYLVKREIIKVK